MWAKTVLKSARSEATREFFVRAKRRSFLFEAFASRHLKICSKRGFYFVRIETKCLMHIAEFRFKIEIMKRNFLQEKK